MPPQGYCRPSFKNDVNQPLTLIALLILLGLGGWLILKTWFMS